MPSSVETAILNKYGFHIRPSTRFMDLARRYDSAISLECGGVVADGKSIMELMTLGAVQGAILRITADGPDEQEALEALKSLVEDRFGGIE